MPGKFFHIFDFFLGKRARGIGLLRTIKPRVQKNQRKEFPLLCPMSDYLDNLKKAEEAAAA